MRGGVTPLVEEVKLSNLFSDVGQLSFFSFEPFDFFAQLEPFFLRFQAFCNGKMSIKLQSS